MLWGYSAQVHHGIDVGEDGRIYALTENAGAEAPPGLESVPARYIAEHLVVLSPEGEELDSIPILEAFRDTPYSLALSSGHGSGPALPGLLQPAGAFPPGPALPP